MKLLTLCIVRRDGKVLFGMKKRGFGAGRWNGFGGKLKEGETIEDAARREVLEETGMTVKAMEKRGVVDFEFQDGTPPRQVHIFSVEDFGGTPTESDEMRPEWFDDDKAPFDAMWTADAYWLPLFLKGKKFRGLFLYDRPSTPEYTSMILEKEIGGVEQL